MQINNKALSTRIPETLLKESQEVAEKLGMHHSTFVRQAIEEKMNGSKRRLKAMEIVKPSHKE